MRSPASGRVSAQAWSTKWPSTKAPSKTAVSRYARPPNGRPPDGRPPNGRQQKCPSTKWPPCKNNTHIKQKQQKQIRIYIYIYIYICIHRQTSRVVCSSKKNKLKCNRVCDFEDVGPFLRMSQTHHGNSLWHVSN